MQLQYIYDGKQTYLFIYKLHCFKPSITIDTVSEMKMDHWLLEVGSFGLDWAIPAEQ